MKVFIHDEKHDRVLDQFDIGTNTEVIGKTLSLVQFLNENVTTRYNRLVVASNYYTRYDELEDYSETVFT